jgi:hypothetical protein
MTFTPVQLLGVVAGVTATAYIVDRLARARSCHELKRLAADWGMNFGQRDTLLLTPKVAAHFPIPGAAHVEVTNVLYGLVDGEWKYVFTAEYTVGVIEQKHRLRRVAAFSEPRDRAGAGPRNPVLLASRELPVIEQYRQLNPRPAEDRDGETPTV